MSRSGHYIEFWSARCIPSPEFHSLDQCSRPTVLRADNNNDKKLCRPTFTVKQKTVFLNLEQLALTLSGYFGIKLSVQKVIVNNI